MEMLMLSCGININNSRDLIVYNNSRDINVIMNNGINIIIINIK